MSKLLSQLTWLSNAIKDPQIIRLVEEGLGEHRLARALGVTRYKARRILSVINGEQVLPLDDSYDPAYVGTSSAEIPATVEVTETTEKPG